ncbi:uncharacterized protein LOC119107804 [Pollicipes pollicipes]|uniref:uncharacterized protein LOC119107738 n=1 Tax=Pollicipes pollicipes TaxID=41117 RepID=UPI0018857DA2|nr:uncharacterized protein LOC119107738 [Pollicipes pollicipes]XP_037087250.1 uncharacterized protein LOC119107804 [Pollicipes pollicipes]
MVTRYGFRALVGFWLLLAAGAGRRLELEYDAMPVSSLEKIRSPYLGEPILGVRRLQNVLPYQSSVERPRFYGFRRIQRPMKRYLGVEIPDEIAGTGGDAADSYIDRLKQQMQNSGK